MKEQKFINKYIYTGPNHSQKDIKIIKKHYLIMKNERDKYKFKLNDLEEQAKYLDICRKEYLERIDRALDFIDIYTDGINLSAFNCLELMLKIENILKGED